MRRLIFTPPLSRAAATSARLAIFAGMTAAVAIIIARGGAGHDPTGALAVLAAALFLAMIALLLSTTAAVEIWNTGRRGASLALSGALVAAGLLGYPAFLAVEAFRLPKISQAATDLKTPPPYMITSKALDARNGWTPPPPGLEIESAQRDAYPQIQSINVDLDPDQTYRMSLRIAKDLGWQVVDASPPNFRGDAVAHIDASERSLLFRFEHEIAIRIRPNGGQSQIDLRSASRVGGHDFGENARQIARFQNAVRQSLEDR